MVAIHIVYQNIIKYHIAKNIRVYNDNKARTNTLYKDEKASENTRKMTVTMTFKLNLKVTFIKGHFL